MEAVAQAMAEKAG